MGAFMANLASDALTRLFEHKLTPQARDAVADRLVYWLVSETRSLPVPDLAARRQAFEVRIRSMCRALSIVPEAGKLRVSVGGAHADTLSMLRRGSSWFAGAEEIDDLIVASVLQSGPRT